jgi:hypothetical protein
LLIEETTVAAEQQAEGGGTDIGALMPEEDSAISLLGSGPEVPLIPPTGIKLSETVETSKLEGLVEELKDDVAADADGAADDVVEEDRSKAEKPKAEKPKAEKPKAEKPKAEKPKAEKLKAEKPKAEKPKVEKPKAEKPKAEKLKAKKPKAEKPKAEKLKAEKVKGAWVGSVSLAEILQHKLVKARHTSNVAALSDLMAQIGLPKALATVHRQMDIQAELEGMEGTNAQVYSKPVTANDLLVAHRATMQLIPMVQATAGAFEHLCELQHELAARLAAMRARLAVPLTAHINEPLILKWYMHCIHYICNIYIYIYIYICTVYALYMHCICTIYALYSLFIHYIAVYLLYIHCICNVYALYSLYIHCIFTVYSLYIHQTCTVCSLFTAFRSVWTS